MLKHLFKHLVEFKYAMATTVSICVQCTYVRVCVCTYVASQIILHVCMMSVGHSVPPSPSAKQSLKVREHQTLGPYVEGLLKLAVTSFSVSGGALKAGSDIV